MATKLYWNALVTDDSTRLLNGNQTSHASICSCQNFPHCVQSRWHEGTDTLDVLLNNYGITATAAGSKTCQQDLPSERSLSRPRFLRAWRICRSQRSGPSAACSAACCRSPPSSCSSGRRRPGWIKTTGLVIIELGNNFCSIWEWNHQHAMVTPMRSLKANTNCGLPNQVCQLITPALSWPNVLVPR